MAERVAPQSDVAADPSPAALEMRGIGKRFGPTLALQGVDLTVTAGEVHALVGENGAGKSTLMKVLSGAISPDAGTMRLSGATYRPRSPSEARRAGVAMIYQELSLAPHLTVEANIMLGVEPGRAGVLDLRQIRDRARRALADLQHPDLTPSALVSSLSPGTQQVVEIARAIAVGCRILVLDEPTSSLTGQDVEILFQVIDGLRAQGKAIVYISHFIEEVKRIADRVTVLRDGQVAGGGPAADLTPAAIVALMVGRDVEELYPRSAREPGEAILTLTDLVPAGARGASSLELHRGEVLGIAGLVGAGRTELLRGVFGLDPVASGRVTVAGFSGGTSPAARWRQGIGIVSEDRKSEGLALGLTLADNITASNLDGLGPAGLVLPGRQNAAARRWISALQLRSTGPTQRVQALSGGNQQKVALARLLHHDVDVLLLDEPTRGIDVGSKAEIYRLIDQLASGSRDDGTPQRPRAVLMVSSYLPELMGVCDRIAVMCRGQLGPARPVEEWTVHDIMFEATGQEAPA
jgi:ribose transport system ATP-binding protein